MSFARDAVRWLLRHSFVRFAIIGSAGYFVAAAMLAFDTDALKLSFAAGNAFSIFVAMGFTWLGNRYFTFADKRARGFGPAMHEWTKFMGANLIGAVVNYGSSLLLVQYTAFPLSDKYVAQALGVLAGLIFNFSLTRALVFKNSTSPI